MLSGDVFGFEVRGLNNGIAIEPGVAPAQIIGHDQDNVGTRGGGGGGGKEGEQDTRTDETGKADGVPVWGRVAAVTEGDEDFTLMDWRGSGPSTPVTATPPIILPAPQ